MNEVKYKNYDILYLGSKETNLFITTERKMWALENVRYVKAEDN